MAQDHAHPSHPSPGREKTSLLALFVGLMAAPAGWVLQHLFGYGLASHACFPGDAPLLTPAPGWGGLRPWLFVLSLAALALTAVGAGAAWRSWRLTRDETAGEHPAPLEVGAGRTRFLAVSGLIVSGLFALSILFDAIMLVGAPLCRD